MQVTASISRLHKLVERIKKRISELNATSTAALAVRSWSIAPTEEGLARVKAQTAKGLDAAQRAIVLTRQLADVRGFISAHNERLGVSARLALIDGLNQQLTQVKNLIQSSSTDTSIEDLSPATIITGYGLSTNVTTGADIAILIGIQESLEKEINRASDQNADANATRVTVDLPDEIAALVGAEPL